MLPQQVAVESAPPTQMPLTFRPGQLGEGLVEEQPASKWPKTLGVVSIVLGGLGLLQHTFGIIRGLASVALASASVELSAADPQTLAALETAKEFAPYLTLLEVVRFALCGLLIAGGVMLMRRAASCSSLLLLWVSLETVAVIGMGVMSFASGQDQVRLMQQSGESMPAGFGTLMTSIGAAGAFIGVAFALIFPLIVTCFMILPKKAAEIASWRPGATLPA